MELQAVAWVTVYPMQGFDATLSLRRQLGFYLTGAYPRPRFFVAS
jgi:hypothetical protein